MNCIYCHENMPAEDDFYFCINHKYTVYYVFYNNCIIRINFQSRFNLIYTVYIYPEFPFEIRIHNNDTHQCIFKTSEGFYISPETIDNFISNFLML